MDFGLRTRVADIPLVFMGSPGAFHQFHDEFDPPLQHFQDIVRNARIFRKKWTLWPMPGWLAKFERIGLISVRARSIDVLRNPTVAEIAQPRMSVCISSIKGIGRRELLAGPPSALHCSLYVAHLVMPRLDRRIAGLDQLANFGRQLTAGEGILELGLDVVLASLDLVDDRLVVVPGH